MFKRIPVFLLAFALGPGLAVPAFSLDNLSLSPLPIPWFEFQEGQMDLGVGGTFLYATGTDIDVYGGGGSFIGRYAFTNLLAMDIGMSIFGGGGDAGDLGVGLFLMQAPVDLELQLVRTNSMALILFGGVMTSFGTLTIGDVPATLSQYGFQFGAQVSFKTSDFTFSPFFMIQSLGGTATVEGVSYSLDTVTVKTFGIDIVYVPWNITLSSMLQMMPAADTDVNIFTIGICYDFQWGGPSESGKK